MTLESDLKEVQVLAEFREDGNFSGTDRVSGSVCVFHLVDTTLSSLFYNAEKTTCHLTIRPDCTVLYKFCEFVPPQNVDYPHDLPEVFVKGGTVNIYPHQQLIEFNNCIFKQKNLHPSGSVVRKKPEPDFDLMKAVFRNAAGQNKPAPEPLPPETQPYMIFWSEPRLAPGQVVTGLLMSSSHHSFRGASSHASHLHRKSLIKADAVYVYRPSDREIWYKETEPTSKGWNQKWKRLPTSKRAPVLKVFKSQPFGYNGKVEI